MELLQRLLAEVEGCVKLFDVDYRAGRTRLDEIQGILARLVEAQEASAAQVADELAETESENM